VLVVGPHKHAIANQNRRGFDFTQSLKCPEGFAIGCIDIMKCSREVADVNDPVANAGGRFANALARAVFPANSTILQTESH
jgi:hypothetical protein